MVGVDIEKARAAKPKALSLALSLLANVSQVQGVGIMRVAKGYNGYGVKVNVDRRPKGIKLPDELDGVPLKFEAVGEIKKRKA